MIKAGYLLQDCNLDRKYVAIVQLKTQQPGVLHEVTLDPDAIHKPTGLIRLGKTPGDEANCWIHPANVMIMAVLGVPKGVWDPVNSQTWEYEELQEAA